jgi:hypothetical protein
MGRESSFFDDGSSRIDSSEADFRLTYQCGINRTRSIVDDSGTGAAAKDFGKPRARFPSTTARAPQ